MKYLNCFTHPMSNIIKTEKYRNSWKIYSLENTYTIWYLFVKIALNKLKIIIWFHMVHVFNAILFFNKNLPWKNFLEHCSDILYNLLYTTQLSPTEAWHCKLDIKCSSKDFYFFSFGVLCLKQVFFIVHASQIMRAECQDTKYKNINFSIQNFYRILAFFPIAFVISSEL